MVDGYITILRQLQKKYQKASLETPSPNLFVSKILKAKYCCKESVFEIKASKTTSWIWQSLTSVKDHMEKGGGKEENKEYKTTKI